MEVTRDCCFNINYVGVVNDMKALAQSYKDHYNKVIRGQTLWVQGPNGKWCHATRQERKDMANRLLKEAEILNES